MTMGCSLMLCAVLETQAPRRIRLKTKPTPLLLRLKG